MVTVPGFNTDIKWQDRVYHVQTEDLKSSQQVESLIFAGGEILAAKRTSYIDPVSPLQPEEIAAFLHHQHQVITSVIKSGFIDELHHRETVKELERLVNLTNTDDLRTTPMRKKVVKPKPKPKPKVEPSAPLNLMDEVFGKIDPSNNQRWRQLGASTMDMTEALERMRLETTEIHPPSDNSDADFEMIGEQNGSEDHANGEDSEDSEYVATPVESRLKVHIYGKDEFFAGDNVPLRIVIKDEEDPFPIKNAEVTVKLVGTAFRPMLWKQTTGADGLAAFDINIPPFTSGTAAFIIDAIAAEGECQERYAVRKAL